MNSRAIDIQKGIEALTKQYMDDYHIGIGSEQVHEFKTEAYLIAILLRLDEIDAMLDKPVKNKKS
jgi:hypothetical protein